MKNSDEDGTEPNNVTRRPLYNPRVPVDVTKPDDAWKRVFSVSRGYSSMSAVAPAQAPAAIATGSSKEFHLACQ